MSRVVETGGTGLHEGRSGDRSRFTTEPGAHRPDFGALVVSLDFELHWGVRDKYAVRDRYRQNLLGARRVVPKLLDLFEEFNIAATWATVGLLFARSRSELQAFTPKIKPSYENQRLSPYEEIVGEGEHDDPLHYAPSLIDRIRERPRQEIATHTFSHYYCRERGQTRDSFEADLASAIAIARKEGIRLTSIVFPRNQFTPEYEDVLINAGITCYRANQRARDGRSVPEYDPQRRRRIIRLADNYVDMRGPHVTSWGSLPQASGLCAIPASFFLRPYSRSSRRLEALRLTRIIRSMEVAALSKGVFHLWWHPHNFGVHTSQNLALLRQILEGFAAFRRGAGMRSLSMAEVANIVARSAGSYLG